MPVKIIYTCKKCDAQTGKWAGRCLDCGAWGTLAEEIRKEKREKSGFGATVAPGKVMKLGEISANQKTLQKTNIKEVDRVLGGGITPGGVYLLAGEPGIGKSTLVAQIAHTLNAPVLYVAGEESPEQLKTRFDRLGISSDLISVLPDTEAETIAATIEHTRPALTIIDSIQSMKTASSTLGAPTQLRASAAILTEIAKQTNAPVMLVGQVTKDLAIAGPKSLEHLVDTVLTFEGDRTSNYRILRTAKNRFGATDEVGVFEMVAQGLKEVANPSSAFLSNRSKTAGSVITCVLEGTRPFLVEIQALATKSNFPYPERRASGFDANRLNLLLAVISKTAKINTEKFDIHVNVTGGFRIKEPAADLAVLLAVASSIKNEKIPEKLLVFGEVGLGGELRNVKDPARRIAEGEKLGFTSYISPPEKNISNKTKTFNTVLEALSFLNLA